MGIIRGLGNINKYIADEEERFANRGERARWFKLADKQSVTVVFLQELDPNSPNYSEKNGLGFLAVEHNNPKNFVRHALCTIDDEGACKGCEYHSQDWKAGWKQKTKLYVNVLVDDGQNDPYVAVLSQGNGPKSITPLLLEMAGEDGTITDKYFKIKREGSKREDTSYMLLPRSAHKLDLESYELFDLDKIVRNIPYDEQEEFYLGGEAKEEANEEPVTAEKVDDTW